VKFLGIDFGWISGPSGLCCLGWENLQLHLLDCDRAPNLEESLIWVDRWVTPTEPALIAVDAPTLIPNSSGMRLPDRLSHTYFHRYHAGCYPANAMRPFAQQTMELGLRLERRGFRHAPTIEPQHPGRYQIEVFPHPAIVHLFDLNRILKYKKGKLRDRALELNRLRQYILDVLPTLEPSLDLTSAAAVSCFPLLEWDARSLSGKQLKAIEDQLDGIICAYVAAHWWYWGLARNWVLGDATTGYIVVPAPIHRAI
jgi:predicted RNase H-like nuclease